MGRKNKLKRFAEVAQFEHVLEPKLEDVLIEKDGGEFKDHPIKGNWHKEFFKNNQPIVLELGCGRGEYSVALGKKYPEKNFLGVDIKGARIWKGAKQAKEMGLNNVGFLRTRIDFIASFFEKGEVDEIWITFPDPQPEERRQRKRLTSPMFMSRYKTFLKSGGLVHLKTDSTSLFDYTLAEIKKNNFPLLLASHDLYAELIEDLDADTQEILQTKTFYEDLFASKGFKIKYCKFTIN